MKRIRQFLESIVYAGMRPGGDTASPRKLKWLGPLRGPIERLLSGGSAPTDPLYLTNRTLAQKLAAWSLIAIPILVILAIVAILATSLTPPTPKPAKPLTAAEITAKLLPNMEKDIQLPPAADVQVVEIKVEGDRIVGLVKNSTKQEIAGADLVIDLTNSAGSQVGAVNGSVEKIPPLGTKNFQIPIKQRDAAYALIREVTLR